MFASRPQVFFCSVLLFLYAIILFILAVRAHFLARALFLSRFFFSCFFPPLVCDSSTIMWPNGFCTVVITKRKQKNYLQIVCSITHGPLNESFLNDITVCAFKTNVFCSIFVFTWFFFHTALLLWQFAWFCLRCTLAQCICHIRSISISKMYYRKFSSTFVTRLKQKIQQMIHININTCHDMIVNFIDVISCCVVFFCAQWRCQWIHLWHVNTVYIYIYFAHSPECICSENIRARIFCVTPAKCTCKCNTSTSQTWTGNSRTKNE